MVNQKTIIGYTSGVYDLFHVGHLNLLRNAANMCDQLIVGVSTDELVAYKNKKAVIPHSERMEIVRHIRGVDAVIPQENMDKFTMWEKLKFNVLFVGDDWYATEKWKEIEDKFMKLESKLCISYTKGTSSTLLNEVLLKLRSE